MNRRTEHAQSRTILLFKKVWLWETVGTEYDFFLSPGHKPWRCQSVQCRCITVYLLANWWTDDHGVAEVCTISQKWWNDTNKASATGIYPITTIQFDESATLMGSVSRESIPLHNFRWIDLTLISYASRGHGDCVCDLIRGPCDVCSAREICDTNGRIPVYSFCQSLNTTRVCINKRWILNYQNRGWLVKWVLVARFWSVFRSAWINAEKKYRWFDYNHDSSCTGQTSIPQQTPPNSNATWALSNSIVFSHRTVAPEIGRDQVLVCLFSQ